MAAVWGDAKPIETAYRGYRFRSRLEARWATFFDAIGVRWEYEAEGFDLDGVRYLPDFWLPDMPAFFEAKPTYPSHEESRKARALSTATGRHVYLFPGNPAAFEIRHISNGPGEPPDLQFQGCGYYWTPDGDSDGCMGWGECKKCEQVAVGWCGQGWVNNDGRLGCQCKSEMRADSQRLLAAFELARSARFEFGR